MTKAFVLLHIQRVGSDKSSLPIATLKERISKIRGVKKVEGVFGRFDFVAVVEVETPEDLGKLLTKDLRDIKEIAETETMVVGF